MFPFCCCETFSKQARKNLGVKTDSNIVKFFCVHHFLHASADPEPTASIKVQTKVGVRMGFHVRSCCCCFFSCCCIKGLNIRKLVCSSAQLMHKFLQGAYAFVFLCFFVFSFFSIIKGCIMQKTLKIYLYAPSLLCHCSHV